MGEKGAAAASGTTFGSGTGSLSATPFEVQSDTETPNLAAGLLNNDPADAGIILQAPEDAGIPPGIKPGT